VFGMGLGLVVGRTDGGGLIGAVEGPTVGITVGLPVVGVPVGDVDGGTEGVRVGFGEGIRVGVMVS